MRRMLRRDGVAGEVGILGVREVGLRGHRGRKGLKEIKMRGLGKRRNNEGGECGPEIRLIDLIGK
jgi:hypothetical protein